MHQHVCTTMLLSLTIIFNLIKNIIFPMFHEHKEMYNYLFFFYFQKAKFGVLQTARVKFSLSGRDGDSNRFLSSWRVIPSTHPSIPRRRANGSPLVQLRNRGSDQRRTPRATTLPGRSGILTHLPLDLRQWSPAHRTSSGSAHFILAGLPA